MTIFTKQLNFTVNYSKDSSRGDFPFLSTWVKPKPGNYTNLSLLNEQILIASSPKKSQAMSTAMVDWYLGTDTSQHSKVTKQFYVTRKVAVNYTAIDTQYLYKAADLTKLSSLNETLTVPKTIVFSSSRLRFKIAPLKTSGHGRSPLNSRWVISSYKGYANPLLLKKEIYAASKVGQVIEPVLQDWYFGLNPTGGVTSSMSMNIHYLKSLNATSASDDIQRGGILGSTWLWPQMGQYANTSLLTKKVYSGTANQDPGTVQTFPNWLLSGNYVPNNAIKFNAARPTLTIGGGKHVLVNLAQASVMSLGKIINKFLTYPKTLVYTFAKHLAAQAISLSYHVTSSNAMLFKVLKTIHMSVSKSETIKKVAVLKKAYTQSKVYTITKKAGKKLAYTLSKIYSIAKKAVSVKRYTVSTIKTRKLVAHLFKSYIAHPVETLTLTFAGHVFKILQYTVNEALSVKRAIKTAKSYAISLVETHKLSILLFKSYIAHLASSIVKLPGKVLKPTVHPALTVIKHMSMVKTYIKSSISSIKKSMTRKLAYTKAQILTITIGHVSLKVLHYAVTSAERHKVLIGKVLRSATGKVLTVGKHVFKTLLDQATFVYRFPVRKFKTILISVGNSLQPKKLARLLETSIVSTSTALSRSYAKFFNYLEHSIAHFITDAHSNIRASVKYTLTGLKRLRVITGLFRKRRL